MKKEKRKKEHYIGRRFAVFALTLALVTGSSLLPGMAEKAAAAENPDVKIEQTGGYLATRGDNNVDLTVKVTNNSKADIVFSAKTSLSATTGDLREPSPNGGKIALGAGESTEVVFAIDVSSSASTVSHKVSILLIDKGENNGDVLRTKIVSMSIIEKSTTSNADPTTPSYAAADLVHSLSPGDAIQAGEDNLLTLTFTNSGNTVMKDARISLTLPAGLYINNGSNTVSVGYVTIGSTETREFHLTADTDLDSKNYPITVTISFKDKTNTASSIEQTLYLPLDGSGSSSLSGLDITDISVPKSAEIGEDFTVGFTVENKGTASTGKLKIYAEPPEGIFNRTQNIFSVAGIAAGTSKSYAITFFSKDSATEQNYPIKLAVETASTKDTASVIQYVGVYLEDSGGGKVKTPQLMVSNYSYGGTFVQAGDDFRLNLELYNTNGIQKLRNIKVAIESADGTFVPVGASNAFFIDELGKKGAVKHSIMMSAKPDAAQKITSMNVNMTYEDTSGNAYTATDVISIPVVQDTRLVVGDIIAPPDLYAGTQGNVTINFYNMGKTVLNNMMIRAEGNFDPIDAASYYEGNVAAGDSDSYDLGFIPHGAGTMKGKVVFSYEDASGKTQSLEKEFSFQIADMPADPGTPVPADGSDKGKGFPWLPAGIGAAVAAAGTGWFFWRRHRKLKKIHEEMEIDE